MSTKLTITLDASVIQRAKQYAKTRGRSLSNLIEDLLRGLTEEKLPSPERRMAAPASKAERLYGILAPLGQDFDYRQAIEEELTKKYL